MADKTKELLQNLVSKLQSEDRSLRLSALHLAFEADRNDASSHKTVADIVKDAETILAFINAGMTGE